MVFSRVSSTTLLKFTRESLVLVPMASDSTKTNLQWVTGWVRNQLLIVIRTRANSILMEEKKSDSRWSETAREFLSELSVPQANPTQPVRDD